jgi:hypothetical protein
MPPQQKLQKIDPLVRKLQNNLITRFESTVFPHIKDMINILNNLVVKS